MIIQKKVKTDSESILKAERILCEKGICWTDFHEGNIAMDGDNPVVIDHLHPKW